MRREDDYEVVLDQGYYTFAPVRYAFQILCIRWAISPLDFSFK